jgi:hypothetical protein
MRKYQYGTSEVKPIGYVSPEDVDPVWKEIQLQSGMSLAELKKLKEAAEGKGKSAQDVASILSLLSKSGALGGGTPTYGEGSATSQALGPAMEQAWAGYQGGTADVGLESPPIVRQPYQDVGLVSPPPVRQPYTDVGLVSPPQVSQTWSPLQGGSSAPYFGIASTPFRTNAPMIASAGPGMRPVGRLGRGLPPGLLGRPLPPGLARLQAAGRFPAGLSRYGQRTQGLQGGTASVEPTPLPGTIYGSGGPQSTWADYTAATGQTAPDVTFGGWGGVPQDPYYGYYGGTDLSPTGAWSPYTSRQLANIGQYGADYTLSAAPPPAIGSEYNQYYADPYADFAPRTSGETGPQVITPTATNDPSQQQSPYEWNVSMDPATGNYYPSGSMSLYDPQYNYSGSGTGTSGSGGAGMQVVNALGYNPSLSQGGGGFTDIFGVSKGGAGTGAPTRNLAGLAGGALGNLAFPVLGGIAGSALAKWITNQMQRGAMPRFGMPRFGGGGGGGAGRGAGGGGGRFGFPRFNLPQGLGGLGKPMGYFRSPGEAYRRQLRDYPGGPRSEGPLSIPMTGGIGGQGGSYFSSLDPTTPSGIAAATGHPMQPLAGAFSGLGAHGGNVGTFGKAIGYHAMMNALRSPAGALARVGAQMQQGAPRYVGLPSRTAGQQLATWDWWRRNPQELNLAAFRTPTSTGNVRSSGVPMGRTA